MLVATFVDFNTAKFLKHLRVAWIRNRPFSPFLGKIASKREESGACSGYPEREQFRRVRLVKIFLGRHKKNSGHLHRQPFATLKKTFFKK